jgi:uncharacterized protein DUF3788
LALSAFDDKAKQPQDEDLARVLGKTFKLWTQLRATVESKIAPVSASWGFTSKTTGWGLRLKQEERAILYMIPRDGYFLASFALGEKAVKAAHDAGLPKSVLDVIDGAKKYAEGRGVRLEVRTAKDLKSIETLAAIKTAN